MFDYSARIVDAELSERLTSIGAVLIDGPKGCGKTVRATHSGIEVSPQDDRELDAVLSADAPIILGLAAGMLALDDVLGLVDIQGDEAAVRAIFGAPVNPSP